MNPAVEFDFFKAVQTAFYVGNKNPNLTSTFIEIAGQFNLDKNKFRQLFESEDFKNKVREDFTRSAEMGVRGFPTVIFKNGDDLFLLSNGYTTAENIIQKVEQVVNN